VKDILFGLVGCGRIGSTAEDNVRKWAVSDLWLPYSHAAAINATPGARLSAACDVKADAVMDAARRHGPLRTYADFKEMFARERLDAVAIATRTAQRKEVILAALAAGVRGIYCEKPLSNSLEEADAIVNAVEHAGAVFVYGTKRRFMPVFERVRNRVVNGEIGTVVSIVIHHGFGSLLWTYPHAVDMALYFAGNDQVESVQADLMLSDASVRGVVVDADPAIRSATIRFRSGLTAVVLPGGGMDLEIVGRDGTVRVEADGNRVRWKNRLADGSDLGWLLAETIDPRDPPSSGTQRSIAALSRAISEQAGPNNGMRVALLNQEILFAMIESHLQGGVRVPFPIVRTGRIITGRTGDLFA
jgi:predicted dehydrogenase